MSKSPGLSRGNDAATEPAFGRHATNKPCQPVQPVTPSCGSRTAIH